MDAMQVKHKVEYRRQPPRNKLLVRSGEIACPWLEAATYAEGAMAYHAGEAPTMEWSDTKQMGWLYTSQEGLEAMRA